ncbi:ABC transporter ATP-binding protein [Blastococcus sp. PRF04-17]|uniref:ABC transporter ATP-binding protein n=1 Tax=Blastococcus sp. PRF04-17 TaxID=2933797 RepID=UPI001FF2EE0D|nr:ABC transporter ATP-binding protein [Blastococcus sp. PRF04-17]UOY03673.1 ABC transporter ATP-binding protein [Blastococcus sp. PRF04-17]
MRTTVDLAGVTKRYRGTVALQDVSLGIGAGVTGLLGPNGAGKTTLLRIVATALGQDAGEVRVLGRDPADPADRLQVRRRLGYLPQDSGAYSGFTAFAFVDYVAVLKEMTDRRARHEEVRRVLDAVGLADRAHAKIRALSGGMRRRVGLAQALLGRPELLVLDEPTVGLDPEQRLRFREVLAGLPDDTTVLLSTHLTEDVAALCSRVVVLDHGRVVFQGWTSELAGIADGHVWDADGPAPDVVVAWRTAEGRFRNVGSPPPGADLVPAGPEHGYLLLTGSRQTEEVLS